MPYQKKIIFATAFRALLFCSVFFISVYCCCHYLPIADTFDRVTCLIMTFAAGVLSLLYIAGLVRYIFEYKYVTDNEILDSLVGVNTYATHEEMRSAFNAQLEKPAYKDQRMILTNEFLADTYENYLFLLNGILDLEVAAHRSSGLNITKITLSIIYLDGERYTFEYREEDETLDMHTKLRLLTAVGKHIEKNSINFHKHVPPK